MALEAAYVQAGICKNTTAYSAGKTYAYGSGRIANGRYVDMQMVRFIDGFPEKIGGWNQVFSVKEGVFALYEWRDQQNKVRIAVGGENHLYTFDGISINDITPRQMLNTITADVTVTTTSGAESIILAYTSDNIAVGDWVEVTSASGSAVGLSGWYYVTAKSGSSTTIINGNPVTAASSATVTLTIKTPKIVIANALSVTAGSSTVTVLGTIAGAAENATLSLVGSYSLGGLQLTGEYVITGITQQGVTFDAGAVAQSTVVGGGNVVIELLISPGIDSSTDGLYGSGNYGVGLYDLSSNTAGYFGSGWILQSYGQQLLAAPIGGTIYVYNPAVGGRAYPLLNAPVSIQAFVVTAERFVIALGIDGNFLQLAWPSQEDYTDWAASLTNTAESGRTLQGGRSFICGVTTRAGITLLFTDKSVFQAQYVGGTYLYDTPMLSDNNGIIGPHAACSIGDQVFWMGAYDFWFYNGSVDALPSEDIRAYVFENLNHNMVWKCHAGTNLAYKEVWFFYPSKDSKECDSYVIYNTVAQCWSVGKLSRSAWIEDNLFSSPYAANEQGIGFVHEQGVDANNAASEWWLETGLMDIETGDMNVNIFGFIADFERLSGVAQLDIETQYYPLGEQSADGPFVIDGSSATARIDLRSDGKAFSYRLSGNELGSDFRLGMCRVDYQPSGARR